MFSVLLCVYGKDDPILFQEAIDSIYKQTLLPGEIVVVVDGPVPEYIDQCLFNMALDSKRYNIKLKTFRLAKNVGHGEARNYGVKNCEHEIVFLCDADDINTPNRFSRQLPVIEESESISVVGSDIKEVLKKSGSTIGKREVKEFHEDIIYDMTFRCPFNQMSVALRKSHVEAVGGYRTVYNNEDYDLWIRLAKSGSRFRNLKESLVYATVNEDFYKRRGGLKYFLSETKMQALLYRSGYASLWRVTTNIMKRFVVQVMMPGSIRQKIFLKFARVSV
ncbi:MAG: glycosyltransferase [Candidatus Paceibacterota bacterium]